MDKSKSITAPKYFAAANSYAGFVSYFNDVFPSGEYDKIYVLKGGPGTGKSSFMRKISQFSMGLNCYVEEILCSSDPDSLDGVIIEKNGKKLAFLDGTSPHERDAILPGACDEIINLGSSVDGKILSKRREKLEGLYEEKKKSYKYAYSYLKLGGEAASVINKAYEEKINIFGLKNKADLFLQDISTDNQEKSRLRLISSFGKGGEGYLETLTASGYKKAEISGHSEEVNLFIRYCYELLLKRGVKTTAFINALNPKFLDALLIDDLSLLILPGEKGLELDQISYPDLLCEEYLKGAKKIRSQALADAERWFSVAKEIHFEMEKIYAEAMNFEINDSLLDKKIEEIKIILENV